MRKAGQRVRIFAQLIDAETEHQVWAARYDRVLEDIFELQDEITTTIAVAINPALDEAGLMRSLKRPPEHLRAWDLVLRARHALSMAKPADIAQAREFAEQAVALAPDSPTALIILARCHIVEGLFGNRTPPKASMEKALEIARRVTSMDGVNPAALVAEGYALLGSRQHDDALVVLQQALDLNVGFARAHECYGYALACSGAYEKAITVLDQAISLSPRDPMLGVWISTKGAAAFIVEKYDEGVEYGHQAIRFSPGHATVYRTFAANLSEIGRNQEAKSSVQTLLRLSPEMSVDQTRKRLLFKNPKIVERFCNALARAGLPD